MTSIFTPSSADITVFFRFVSFNGLIYLTVAILSPGPNCALVSGQLKLVVYSIDSVSHSSWHNNVFFSFLYDSSQL